MSITGQIHPFHGLGKPALITFFLFTLGFGLVAIEWFMPNQFKLSLSVSIEENERLAQQWIRVQRRLTTCALVGMFCLIAKWAHARHERIRARRVQPTNRSEPVDQEMTEKTN
ncbi:hypothetical protein FGIG_03147 [Fasciola gigantica]|uniref:Transmembrane protein n=1 Tax=Fasciola gigantica TaxID=46835 RepID=A0A504YN99_FASGI|nr:hypothetical protein FGIG_03147 [Fasciola gigantica]